MMTTAPHSARGAWRAFATLLLALVLGGCAVVSKVSTGEAVVRNRVAVTVDTPWNKFERGLGHDIPTWTIEGVTVDALEFFVGIKHGEPIVATPSSSKNLQPLTFLSTMPPQDIVALYQSMITRDGSTFTLDKLEPADFLGGKGFRFEFTRVRKYDDVRQRGIAYGTVRNGELHLISYVAPRLGFFPKYVGRAEAIAKSARLKG